MFVFNVNFENKGFDGVSLQIFDIVTFTIVSH